MPQQAANPQPDYSESMVDRDRCRAILETGEWAGLWEFHGMHENSYVVQHPGKRAEPLSTAQVIDLAVRYFLELKPA